MALNCDVMDDRDYSFVRPEAGASGSEAGRPAGGEAGAETDVSEAGTPAGGESPLDGGGSAGESPNGGGLTAGGSQDADAGDGGAGSSGEGSFGGAGGAPEASAGAAGDEGTPSTAGGNGGEAGAGTGGCEVGQTQACSESGAEGTCANGEQTCLDGNLWGACSIAPAGADGCAVEGDDATCDGIANQGCECIGGETRSCSEGGLLGKCASGTQTCTDDGEWGACSITPSAGDTCVPGNDDDCNGNENEGCPCNSQASRACSQGGYFGSCAGGTQTCDSEGVWGECSIPPAGQDSCESGNDDNCSGVANEGCLCIEGVSTRSCGECDDGSQTCTGGKAGTYGTCSGATAPSTYYRDSDGDGHSTANNPVSVCGGPPPGYLAAAPDDCCDTDGRVHPDADFSIGPGNGGCGRGWDFNCDDDVTERWPGVYLCTPVYVSGWQGTIPGCGGPGQFRSVSAQNCSAAVDRTQECR